MLEIQHIVAKSQLFKLPNIASKQRAAEKALDVPVANFNGIPR